jgi:hypothetical protein
VPTKLVRRNRHAKSQGGVGADRDVRVLDHVITSDADALSMAEQGLL